jgi:tetratricopeptide (TPR) repeat protein
MERVGDRIPVRLYPSFTGKETFMMLPARVLSVMLITGLLIPPPVMSGGDEVKSPYDLGEMYLEQKNYESAMRQYRKALELNDVRAHYKMGLIYEETGRGRDALKHFRRTIELGQPGSEWDDAAERARRIEERLNTKTTRSAALLEKGRELFLEMRYREAEEILLEAVKNDETNPDIHFYLGEVYFQLGEYGKAEGEYLKAREYY